MNILDAEDLIKGLPDEALTQEAQMPSGQVPQFLVVSEIQRRTDMRKRYQAQQQEAMPSVKDQIVQEGIMGMMPQQPMGMPQGMPQQMPQQMPPQMPPQMPQQPMGMAQGGIARMANGGSTGMPGAYSLYGMQKEYIDPLLERAQVLAQTARVSIEEAYEVLKREAAMNMPNYGMLAPAGNDIPGVMSDMSDAMGRGIQSVYDRIPQSSPDGGMVGRGMDEAGRLIDRGMDAMGRAMPERRSQAEMAEMFSSDEIANRLANRPSLSGLIDRGADAVDSAGNYISSAFDSAVDSAGDYLGQAGDYISSAAGSAGDYLGQAGDYIADDVRRSVAPIRAYEAGRSQRVSDAFDEGGYGAGIGQLLREAPGSVENVLRTAFTDFANLPPITGAANMLDQLVTGSTDDPFMVFGGSKSPQTQATKDVSVQGSDDIRQSNARLGIGPQGVVSDVLGRKAPPVDPPTPGSEPVPSPISELLDAAIASNTDASRPDPDPRLDISDILGESRKMTQANMLMQLGAGIAGGDLSKGISAAGAAGMKGAQQQQALDIRKRLAEYQAGREDIARGDAAELTREKIRAELSASRGTTQRELIRFYADQADGLRKKATALAPLGGSLTQEELDTLQAITDMVSEYSSRYGLMLPEAPPPSQMPSTAGFSVVSPKG